MLGCLSFVKFFNRGLRTYETADLGHTPKVGASTFIWPRHARAVLVDDVGHFDILLAQLLARAAQPVQHDVLRLFRQVLVCLLCGCVLMFIGMFVITVVAVVREVIERSSPGVELSAIAETEGGLSRPAWPCSMTGHVIRACRCITAESRA